MTAELVKWLEDASAVTAQIREGAVWLRDYQGSSSAFALAVRF